jgi:RNA-binding protein YhbY
MVTIFGGKLYAKRLAQIAKQLNKPGVLRVGFFANATYPDGTKVAMIAAIQEFGAPKARIPPRPFFRTMVAAKSPEWPRAVKAQLKANNYDVEQTLRVVGQGIRDQLQQSIRDTLTPALSPVTLMLRKMKKQKPGLVVTRATVGEAARRVAAGQSTTGVSTKPLVETGVLINSVDFEVKTS